MLLADIIEYIRVCYIIDGHFLEMRVADTRRINRVLTKLCRRKYQYLYLTKLSHSVPLTLCNALYMSVTNKSYEANEDY